MLAADRHYAPAAEAERQATLQGSPKISPAQFHLLVKNRFRHFRCDNVKHDNQPDDQQERNGQRAESKNLSQWGEG